MGQILHLDICMKGLILTMEILFQLYQMLEMPQSLCQVKLKIGNLNDLIRVKNLKSGKIVKGYIKKIK